MEGGQIEFKAVGAAYREGLLIRGSVNTRDLWIGGSLFEKVTVQLGRGKRKLFHETICRVKVS